MTHPKRVLATRLRHTALYLIAAGALIAATLATVMPDSRAPSPGQVVTGSDGAGVTADDPAYQAQIERMGGSMGWYMVEFQNWFARRWQGANLGITLGVLAILVALILRFVARELDAAVDHESETGVPEPGREAEQ